MKYLHELGARPDLLAFTGAMQEEHWECLRFLLTRALSYQRLCICTPMWSVFRSCWSAALVCTEYGDLLPSVLQCDSARCLQYLHSKSLVQWTEEASIEAAKTGALSCLRFAHERGCTLNPAATAAAARNGCQEMLQYLHEHSCALGRFGVHCSG